MPILVIRHAISEANNRENVGTMAFGAKDAPLMEGPLAIEQARKCRETLQSDHRVNVATTSVSVSQLLRTQQTARAIGFKGKIVPSGLLNEVEHGLELNELKRMLDSGQLPPAALVAAEAILKDPPPQKVWVTHGLVIAGLSQVLGVHRQFKRLIPRFCEVRVLSV